MAGIKRSGIDRIVRSVSQERLKHNYRVLARLCPNQQLLPMIKANAYGHGAVWAASVLKDMPRLAGFGVATIDEALELREVTSLNRKEVIVFSGGLPWNEEKAKVCEKKNITAVITNARDWKEFYKKKHYQKVKYQLEWNTGMNRLGISMDFLPNVVQDLRILSEKYWPVGVFSHLAQAEKPSHNQSKNQFKQFLALREGLKFLSPKTAFHLANSAAMWKKSQWKLDQHTHWVRPGVALYGHAPWYGAPTHGIRPVMQLHTTVGATDSVHKGQWIGYGGTFRVTSAKQCIGVATAGYADGVIRHLSNNGQVWIKGKSYPMLGRVSMDLFSFACSKSTKPGDSVEIFGDHLDCWKQAKSAGTIPYELMTALTQRVTTLEY